MREDHPLNRSAPMPSVCKKLILLFIVSLLGLVTLQPVLHPFGKNKVTREVFRWKILKTVHFDVYYPAGMEDLGLYSAKIAEEGYVHISNYLNHELTQVIPIVVYPSHIDFQENNILLQVIGEGIGGFTEAFKNRVVVPFTGSYRELRHVLTHELTHAFQFNMLFDDVTGATMSRLTYGGMPLWIMEGMCEYISAGYDETADMVMRDIIYNEQYATLMDLTRLQVRSGYLIYKEGQAFFYFLEKRYGRERIGELFRDIRDLNDFDEALKICTGKTLEELNLEWIRFFKKRYFPVVRGKNFDEEEGEQYTFHLKTESSFNVCPAVSPDGREIAYITNMDIYSGISVVTLEKKEERKVRRVIRGETSEKFEAMHLMTNYMTWSADGKRLAFVAQSRGRDMIFFIDPKDGKIEMEIKFPFRAIMDPSLSRDGRRVSFIGQGNEHADVYVYDLEKEELRRITHDAFSERYPRLSSDGRFVIYSSNYNPEGNREKDGYDIFKADLKTGERKLLVSSEENNLQADLSPDDRSVLYISNRTGIYNAYRFDMDTGTETMLTNVLCGVFYPRWFPDGKKMAFVAYQNVGYDIFVKDIGGVKPGVSAGRDTEHVQVQYPAPYFDFSRSAFDDYSARLSPDWIYFGLGGTSGYGLALFARMAISDYLGDHRLVITTDYLNYSYGGGSDVNFDVAYYFLKHRWDYGMGAYRQSNPYGLITLDTITDVIINNVYFDTIYMKKYGAYFLASYPFSKFFRFTLQGTSSRYEHDYTATSERLDTYANLNQVSLSLTFDNVLWGHMVPVDGTRGQVQVEQAIDITGQDFEFTMMSADIRQYYLLFKRYVFAFRGSGGKVFGEDSEYFKFYLGGFNTLRGHPFFEYSGGNYFLGNMEFRFILIEGIKMGWPLFFRVGGIGGVLFTDVGSTWDENYVFYDEETGEFADFKTDVGFGFRFAIYPLFVLKLDYAWPYYYKFFGDMQITFSLGFDY